jgi:hypothetical protein
VADISAEISLFIDPAKTVENIADTMGIIEPAVQEMFKFEVSPLIAPVLSNQAVENFTQQLNLAAAAMVPISPNLATEQIVETLKDAFSEPQSIPIDLKDLPDDLNQIIQSQPFTIPLDKKEMGEEWTKLIIPSLVEESKKASADLGEALTQGISEALEDPFGDLDQAAIDELLRQASFDESAAQMGETFRTAISQPIEMADHSIQQLLDRINQADPFAGMDFSSVNAQVSQAVQDLDSAASSAVQGAAGHVYSSLSQGLNSIINSVAAQAQTAMNPLYEDLQSISHHDVHVRLVIPDLEEATDQKLRAVLYNEKALREEIKLVARLLELKVKNNQIADAEIELLGEKLQSADEIKKIHEADGTLNQPAFNALMEQVLASQQLYRWNAMAANKHAAQLETLGKEIRLRLELGESIEAELETYRQTELKLNQILQNKAEVAKYSAEELEYHRQMLIDAGKLSEEIREQQDGFRKISEYLSEIGLGNIGRGINDLRTTEGLLRHIVNNLGTTLELMDEWKLEQYSMYGPVDEVAQRVRDVGQAFHLIPEDARKAMTALMDVGIANDSLEELAGILGRVHASTGMNEKVLAVYMRRLQGLNQTNSQISQQMTRLTAFSRTYNLTAEDMTERLGEQASKVYELRAAMGSQGFEDYQNGMLAVMGTAKKLGLDVGRISGVFRDLEDDAEKFVAVLGADAIFKTPAENFDKLVRESGRWNKFITDMPVGLRKSMSKEITGMDYETLQQMDKFRSSLGTTEAEISAKLAEIEKSGRSVADAFKDWRDSTTPKGAWLQFLNSLGATLSYVLKPITWLIMGLTKLVMAYNELGVPTKHFINVLLFAGLAVLTFGGYLTRILMPFGMVFRWLGTLTRSLFGFRTAAGAASSATGGLGKGFANFIKNIMDGLKAIDLRAVAKGTLALLMLGGALWVLSKALKGTDPATMLAASSAIVVLSGALFVLSRSSSSSYTGILKGALALGIMGGALALLAYATKDLPASKILTVASSMVILSGAMLVLGQVGQVSMRGMVAAGVGLGLVAASMLIMGKAMEMASPGKFMLMAAALGLFGVVLAGLAVLTTGLAVPMLIFAGVLLAVSAALWVTAKAITAFADGAVILDKVNLVQLGLGMVTFAAALLGASLVLLPAMATMVAALGLGSIMLPLAYMTHAALVVVGAGLAAIMPYASQIGELQQFAGQFSGIMALISAGMWEVVKSPYARFGVAAMAIGIGLRTLLSGALLANAAALETLAEGFGRGMAGLSQGMEQVASSRYVVFPIAANGIASGLVAIFTALLRLEPGRLQEVSRNFNVSMYAIKEGSQQIGYIGSDFKSKAEQTGIGIYHILNVLNNNKSGLEQLPNVAKNFGAAMSALKDGTYYVNQIDAAGFKSRSGDIAAALDDIFAAIGRHKDGVVLLENLANALSKIQALQSQIQGQLNGNQAAGGKSILEMSGLSDKSLLTAGRNVDAYATYVEQAADRVNTAIESVTSRTKQADRDMSPLVKSDSVVSVRHMPADVTERSNHQRELATKVDGIATLLGKLVEIGQAALERDNGSTAVSQLKEMVEEALPMLEQKYSGLVGRGNSWSRG